MSLQLKNQTTGFFAWDNYEQYSGYGGAGSLPPYAMDMWMETPPHTLFSTAADERWRWQITVSLDLAVAGTPTVNISLPNLRAIVDPR